MRVEEHPKIAEIRRQAKLIAKTKVLSHCQALDAIAQENGYKNFKHIKKEHEILWNNNNQN